jgi:hypothetical protein
VTSLPVNYCGNFYWPIAFELGREHFAEVTFLPVMERELRARARGRGLFWTRFMIGFTGVLICLPQLLVSPGLSRGLITGNKTFEGMVVAGFLFCCGGCLLTAEGINGERREGTLELLFLTRVRFLDLLLGKLGAAGITLLGALLTLLPLLAIPAMAGGVTGGEIVRAALALVNTLFLSLAIGFCATPVFGAGSGGGGNSAGFGGTFSFVEIAME